MLSNLASFGRLFGSSTATTEEANCESTSSPNSGQKEGGDGVEELISCMRKLASVAERVHNRDGEADGCKVLEFLQPNDRLEQLFSGVGTFDGQDVNASDPLKITPEGLVKDGQQGGAGEAAVDEILADTIRHSVKTDHPYFLNAFYHGTDYYGKIGAYLSEIMNTNAYSYEVAPVFTLIEKSLVEWYVGRVGWASGDGLTCPGGSIANMYAMVMARHRKFPQLKREGVSGMPPLVIYTSDESHYSVAKGANWLGIGLDNVVYVETDDLGGMIPERLQEAIQKTLDEGKVPLMVNATVGSTVVGAFDDLTAIRLVLDKFEGAKIWLHADACVGGTYLLNEELSKQYVSGSELTDSLCWNPHKLLGAPLQATLLVYREDEKEGTIRLIHNANCASASYLFQQDKFYDVSFDTGDKSVQCGRKSDAFKIWLMMKVRGEKWWSDTVMNAHRMSRLLKDKVDSHPNFKMVMEPSCININFVYTPPSLQKLKSEIPKDEWQSKQNKVAPTIKAKMMKEGSLMVAYQPLKSKGLGNFFRMVFHCQPVFEEKNVDFIISEIHRLGENIDANDL